MTFNELFSDLTGDDSPYQRSAKMMDGDLGQLPSKVKLALAISLIDAVGRDEDLCPRCIIELAQYEVDDLDNVAHLEDEAEDELAEAAALDLMDMPPEGNA